MARPEPEARRLPLKLVVLTITLCVVLKLMVLFPSYKWGRKKQRGWITWPKSHISEWTKRTFYSNTIGSPSSVRSPPALLPLAHIQTRSLTLCFLDFSSLCPEDNLGHASHIPHVSFLWNVLSFSHCTILGPHLCVESIWKEIPGIPTETVPVRLSKVLLSWDVTRSNLLSFCLLQLGIWWGLFSVCMSCLPIPGSMNYSMSA